MKRGLLTLFSVLGFIGITNAQVEIYANGGTTDVSGTTLQISPAGPGTILTDFTVVNNTGVTKNWTIKRVRINEQATWSDYLCWGQTGGLGNCYAASQMDQTTWTNPDAATIDNTMSGDLQSDITPDENTPATVTYAYYIMNGNIADDSVFIEISFSASAPALTPQLSVNVAPNPASESFTVTTGTTENASVKILDVLGNEVYKETIISESKDINISRFKNGVYFVIVEAPGAKTVNRKLIVRH